MMYSRTTRLTFLPAVLVALLVSPAAPASSQAVNGAIVGRVADPSGAVLPGVTITASSPSLIKGATVVTTVAEGTYEVSNLPPGVYTVTAELQGFGSAKRENVVVQAGRTVAADFDLKVGSVAETVTVSGQAPLVDVSNTRIGTNVDEAFIANIPTGRSFTDILNIQPGVNEAPYTFSPVNSVQGSNVRANNYSMDGHQMVDAAVGYFIGDIDYDSLQEVQVTTGGISAEFGQASGGVFNFITKSGSDKFSSGQRFYLNNSALNSSNITSDLASRGVSEPTQIKSKYNESVDLGGPLMRQKLWFYTDVARNDFVQSVSALAGIVDPKYGGYDDLEKVTWQATTNNQFVVSHQSRHLHWVPANADNTIVPNPAVLSTYGVPGNASWILQHRKST